MKYLALLKDSFKESMDSRILYVTMALSLVVIAFLGSINFHPTTAKEQAEVVIKFLNFQFKAQRQFRNEAPNIEIIEYKQLNEGEKPWHGDYRIVFQLTIPEEMAKTAEGNEARFLSRILLEETFKWMKKRKVREIEITAPKANDVEPEVQVQKKSNKQSGKKQNKKDTPPDGNNPPKKAVEKDTKQIFQFTFTNEGTTITDRKGWDHDIQLFFGAAPLSSIPLIGIAFLQPLGLTVFTIEYYLVNNIGGTVIVLLGIIVTAFFVPSMLQKGTVDLLISKPISRSALLIFKYLGGVLFVFLNALIAIGGVWLVIGLRTGIWTYGFPLTVPIISFFFAILFSISVLFGVITRNSLVCILFTLIIWALLFGIGMGHSSIHAPPSRGRPILTEKGFKRPPPPPPTTDKESNSFVRFFDVAYAVLPRTNDLGYLTTRILGNELLTESERSQYRVRQEESVNVWETLAYSIAFIAVMLGLACWRFSARDH